MSKQPQEICEFGAFHLDRREHLPQRRLDDHRAGVWRHWVVIESGVYFATEEQPKQALIEFFSFAARQVTPVATLQKGVDLSTPGLAISPDGR